jgi:2-oxoisovalerate dehydrogenase E2 component (dihydrolipoyl transacylase)
MAEKVVMPQLGESVTEGTISKWLVNVGDMVNKYDPICEVTTDKVNAEVPSSFTGKITEIVISEGETVDVGTLICYIEAEGKAASEHDSSTFEVAAQESKISAQNDTAKLRYSPAVLKLAAENEIDLSRLQGTGTGGRITRKDVLTYMEHGRKALPQEEPKVDEASAREEIQSESIQPAADITLDGDEVLPISPIRKTIAERMVKSKHVAPHAWMMVECDVTSLVTYRNQVKDEFKKKEGINLTYLPFFIKAVVESLKEFPIMNSAWAEDKIIIKKNINISIAVATERELFVPVIRDADQRSVLGIAKSIDDLAGRARQGKLKMEDITGGTFTVNNTGAFGSVLSAPIINQPQAAILSVESIVKRPMIINNMIAVRDMVNLCLSLDHRVLDGLVCGHFLQLVKQKLERYGPDTKLY